MRKLTLNLARILALCVMGLTPWLYGGTLPWTIELVSQCLLGVTALAILGWLIAWQKPKIGWVLPVSLGLLALGWLSALHPRSRYDEFLLVLFPLADSAPLGGWFYGSVDGERSIRAMWRLTGLLGLLWIARDMATEKQWRKAIVWAVVFTGTSVAIHGLIQKSAGDIWGYWQGRKLPGTVFAGFWYHANAAALLNLTCPFVAALCLDSFAKKKNQFIRALLLISLLALIVGALVNVSKAGHIILGLQLLLFTALVMPTFIRSLTGVEKVSKVLLMTLALTVISALGLSWLFGSQQSTKRWEELTMERVGGGDGRFASSRFCLEELPRAGWNGYGAGTFEVVFMDTGTTHPERVPKRRWRYAHQDSLQTLLEWGWLGGSVWIGLGLGLLAQSLRRLEKLRQVFFSSRHTLQAAAVTSLAGIAIHSQTDFPLQILGVQVLVAMIAGFASQHSSH